MIYAMIDLTGNQVVDILAISGKPNAGLAERKDASLKELTQMHQKLSGKKREFKSEKEALGEVTRLIEKRCFPNLKGSKDQKDGPVAKVRRICSQMKGKPRHEIIEACAKAGVKRSTASVQYQRFKTLNPIPPLPASVPVTH